VQKNKLVDNQKNKYILFEVLVQNYQPEYNDLTLFKPNEKFDNLFLCQKVFIEKMMEDYELGGG
jgi:hypothetical protein